MRFSNISELELAKLFVYSKKEKIEKLLDIKNLNTWAASEILYNFIRKNSDIFWDNYSNKYEPLFDDVFFCAVIDELKNNGTQLDGATCFNEPNVMYVS